MAKAKRRCDACGKRLRPGHHEAVLTDFETGQQIGHYHAPGCQGAALKYLMNGGGVFRMTYLHPDRCGPEQERCDGGLLDTEGGAA